jgi:hypothetical protein
MKEISISKKFEINITEIKVLLKKEVIKYIANTLMN